MTTIADLVQARNDARDRGDKALAREIYHQLQTMGVEPHAIDAGTVEEALASTVVHEPEVEGEPSTPPVVEAAVAEPPEVAVPPKPRGRPRSNS